MADVAALALVSEQLVGMWETGKRRPSQEKEAAWVFALKTLEARAVKLRNLDWK